MTSMDATKKAQLEKWIVLALAGVFVVILVMGPARSVWWHPAAPAVSISQAPAMDPVHVKPIGDMVEEAVRVTSSPQIEQHAPAAAEAAPRLYAAQALRDPLQTFLPQPPPPEQSQEALNQVEASKPLPPPPPELTIQGIVWGGPEPRAIINGHVYAVHDMIDTSEIVAITRGGVTLLHEGQLIDYASQSAGMPMGSGAPLENYPQQAQWR